MWNQIISETYELVNDARAALGKKRWNFAQHREEMIGDDRCAMCRELGFPDILAHFKAVPAGQSPTGKAVPALCFDHKQGRVPKHIEKLNQERAIREGKAAPKSLRVHDLPKSTGNAHDFSRTTSAVAVADEEEDPEIIDARNNHGQGESDQVSTEIEDDEQDEQEEQERAEPDMEEEPELCHCGRPYGHTGRHKGGKGLISVRTAFVAAPDKEGHPCACNCGAIVRGAQHYAKGHKKNPPPTGIVLSPPPTAQELGLSVAHSVTHRVTVERESEVTIELGRRVNIMVPRAKAQTQVKLTPEIARAVWESLSKEEKADLMGVDDMWDGYDDDMRMITVSRVLLIDPSDIPKTRR